MKDENNKDEVMRDDLLNIMVTVFAILTLMGTLSIGVLHVTGFTNIF
jgi:hypothetical protein